MNALYDKVHSFMIYCITGSEKVMYYELPRGVILRSDLNGKRFHLFHPGHMEKVKILQPSSECWIHRKIKWTECFGTYLPN